MAYDESFFKAYRAYLQEDKVRENHNEMFRLFSRMTRMPLSVVDLGCGVGEFYHLGVYYDYLGVDRQNWGGIHRDNFVQGDYTNLPKDLRFSPEGFISLFSIEACFPASERYALYAKLFRETDVKWGMSAGFYYTDKRNQAIVSEAGDIVSHQTIESLGEYACEGFEEQWMTLRTPSKMFGDTVVEVWKFFRRAGFKGTEDVSPLVSA